MNKEIQEEEQEQGPGDQGVTDETPGAGEAEQRSAEPAQDIPEVECEEASPGQHNSSGYASDGSGDPGGQPGDQGPAAGQRGRRPVPVAGPAELVG